MLTGECTKVRRLKIIPQLGKPLVSPRGAYKIITETNRIDKVSFKMKKCELFLKEKEQSFSEKR